MKNKNAKLILVISLSLFLLIAFYNKTFADITAYYWTFGQPQVKMLPIKEGLCALTGISGKLRGGGEQVYVYKSGDHDYDYWYLGGQSLQGFLWASAHCIKYKDFGANFASILYGERPHWEGCAVDFCVEPEMIVPFNVKEGDCKSVFLRAISGDFERITSTPSIQTGHVIVKSKNATYNAPGVSFKGRTFVHQNGKIYYKNLRAQLGCLRGQAAPDMRYGTSGIIYKRGEFKTPYNQDIKTNYLANSHFCTMAGVSGFFHGGGERVNLTINKQGEWIMQGQTMQKYTGMTAWCFRFR